MHPLRAREAAGSAAADTGQYLTFQLDSELYGIPILEVQEIKGYSAPTPIPGAPSYVRGVMNLRGTVVPVVDLRSRFGMPALANEQFAVIVVVTVPAGVFGLVVDAVSDVLDIPAQDIEPAPELGASRTSTAVTGLAKTGDRLAILLGIDRILELSTLHMDAVDPASAASAA